MDRFLTVCGASGPIRLEIQSGVLRRRSLPHAFALVGRSASADLRLNHPQVSLRHAYLQLVDGRLACFDLGGRAGVQWDDGRPARSGWLDAGRSLGIGPFLLRRMDEAPRIDEARSAAPPDASPLNADWAALDRVSFSNFPTRLAAQCAGTCGARSPWLVVLQVAACACPTKAFPGFTAVSFARVKGYGSSICSAAVV